MDRLTSSRSTASVLLIVLLVKQGAGVQPECDFQEFYELYSPVVGNLIFRVTGQLNSPHILEMDCNALKNVTQRVETFLEGCTADNNEDLKKRIRALQLARDSLCGSELEEDLNLWQDCFNANVFAECKKNVEERLRKLEQDGALEAAGDFVCRNESLGFQCALQAGAGCPEKAERARKAVENYINLLMDVKMCRRPTEYACEGDLFDHCYWTVMSGTAGRLPLLPSGADTLSKYCKAAKSVPTCTRNLQIEQCPEEKKEILGTIKDGFRSIPDSICNEELPASVEEWNKCLNQEALKKCESEIPRPNQNFDSKADRHVHFCREREETLKCELAAGSDCPASASAAKEALYDLRAIELGLLGCPRPSSQTTGAGVQPECDFQEFYKLYSPVVGNLIFRVTGQLNSPHILERDCDALKNVTQRVETFLEGCTADNNEDLKKRIRALQLARDSLCGSELEEDLNLWQDCFNANVFAECKKNVEERLRKLEQDGALEAAGDFVCRNQSLGFQCALHAGAGCPEKAERARKAVENYINLLMDVKLCRRPTEYACEGDLFYHCYWTVMGGPAGRLPLLPSGADTLSKYCKAAKSVPTCTRNLQIEQCSEEKKEILGTIKDGFRSIPDSICNEELPASVEEWNKCLNQEALRKCMSEIPRPNLKFDSQADMHVHFCREREETLKCELAAGSDCPASASAAEKALYDLRAIELGLLGCPRPSSQTTGAGVQPECDFQEFYKLYSPVVGNLIFRVTGQLNSPHILERDCDALKNVTQRVETFLEGCTADNNEDLKKHIRALQLARDSLCGSELEEDLNLWQDCFNANVFAECKKNVEERLRKLEQDGALEAAGDFVCRNQSLGFQCALQAGAGCPEKAERARKAVENYINLLMDVKMCRRPTEYACEGDLFYHCYWTVMSGPAGRLPLLPSGADTLSKYCKAAKSVPTCTRNLQIEQCPEEKKEILGTIKDGFRSIPDSICNEELPASVEEWNKCLNQEALRKCMSEIPRPNLKFDSQADMHVHFCREREETLKCELAAGSDCPASASAAEKALYDLRAIELGLLGCPRPSSQTTGAGVQPECDFQEFYKLYSPVVGNLIFRVTGQLNSPHILERDCDALKNVTQRVETFLEGCTADNNEDLKKHIRALQLARDSLCGSELEEDLNLWQDCFNANVFAECKKNVEERLRKLEQDGALEAAGDFVCRNQSLGFQCALQAGAGCPEKAERARKAVENYINLLMDVKMCRRPTEYACEGDLFYHCYWTVMGGPAGRLPLLPSGADTLSKYCKAAKSVPTCTRNLQIEQCPEEKKEILGTIKDGFRSIPDSICNEELPASVEEWNKCLNQEALKKCESEIPRPNQNFDSEADRHVHFCRDREETLKCELAAGSNCPASASVAKKALYELRAMEHNLYNCPRRDGWM